MTTSKLVLIADDYDATAELMARLVESATPHRGLPARDGRQALALAEEHLPDICILDLDMPVMGGMETARALRALFGEHRPLLIGMADGGAYFEAAQSGVFDEVLRKPIHAGRLLGLIERA